MHANIFQCKNTSCQVFFQNSHDLKRHHCKTLTEAFPGKIAQPQTNVFAKLEDEGLSFQSEDKVFPYRCIFDYESSFSISSLPKSGPRTTFLNRNVAMAVGVQTNVPGFSEFQCFTGEPEQIVQQKLEYLEKASAQANELLKRKFSFVHEFLEVRLIDLEEDERKKHPLGRLLLEFDGYLKCLPVCTFDDGRYDIPLSDETIHENLLEDRLPQARGFAATASNHKPSQLEIPQRDRFVLRPFCSCMAMQDSVTTVREQAVVKASARSNTTSLLSEVYHFENDCCLWHIENVGKRFRRFNAFHEELLFLVAGIVKGTVPERRIETFH
ncbi:unnamed protein product [Clavelina lepadiformis]|uniref:C2H2-type domain-containing protein n=1 Tax=Clavelina lepadiformis TaxID=159417 RepID=A0ABP0G6G0_CLALP